MPHAVVGQRERMWRCDDYGLRGAWAERGTPIDIGRSAARHTGSAAYAGRLLAPDREARWDAGAGQNPSAMEY